MKKLLKMCAISIGLSLTFVSSHIVMASAVEDGAHIRIASFFKLGGQSLFQ